MKAVKLFLRCFENVKHDGACNLAELHSVQLDDGRYVSVQADSSFFESTTLDAKGYPDFSKFLELTSDEESEFDRYVASLDTACHNRYEFGGEERVQVGSVLLSTSNPVVYGVPDKYLEFCGVQVLTEDVNECTSHDCCDDDEGPFVVDLGKTVELVEYTLEQSSHNKDGSCVVCYYAGVPAREQVVSDLATRKGQLGLSCDTADKYFGYEEVQTKVSERASLHRYECYPCG